MKSKRKKETPKKPKKRSKKSLRAEADRLVGKACRSTGYCEICRSNQSLQWCHFISRGVIKLRYDKRNYACLCARCHFRGHQHPAWFVEQWDKIRGNSTALWLELQSSEVEPIRDEFYINIINQFKEVRK